MGYTISLDVFKNGKMFNSAGNFTHNTGYRFKLFPYVTKKDVVASLTPLVGTYLCMIEGNAAEELNATKLFNMIRGSIKILPGQETLLYNVIRNLFFSPDGKKVRPLNLELMEHNITNGVNENKIAKYLVDVLGDKASLKLIVENAKKKEVKNSNVLEKLVLTKLTFDQSPDSNEQDLSYFAVVHSLKNAFEEDFAYILENPKRTREYLASLMEFYYFMYTSQTSMQLNRFLEGERGTNIPLYFSLEWEKTSQSRLCYTEGWQKLERSLKKMFAHVTVLELLNHTVSGSELVDYIRIAEITKNDVVDKEISEQIDEITNYYRKAIKDSPEMNELHKEYSLRNHTDAAIHYLFESVKTQFENTDRSKAYNTYANNFIDYCLKFLKSRGRSGLMLNLTEEMLIFLTVLSIKNQEEMRLKDVFNEFERRGVFLDNFSKDQVATYYEKLNLIEKKSDSGDAKYVKRIL